MQIAWSPSSLKVITHRSGNAKVCESCCECDMETVWLLNSSGETQCTWFSPTKRGLCIKYDGSGAIYVGNHTGTSGSPGFCKINSSCSQQWGKILGNNRIITALAIDSSGFIYVSRLSTLYKYNSSGVLQWTFDPGDVIMGTIHTLHIDSNDNIYAACGPSDPVDGYTNLWSIDTDGNTNWRWASDDTQSAIHLYGVDVDSSGNVWVGGMRAADNKSVWKVSSLGSELAAYDTGGLVYQVAVNSGDSVFVGGTRINSYSVWKIASDAISEWYDTGDSIWDVRVDNSDNVLICPAASAYNQKVIYKINSSAVLQWSLSLGNTRIYQLDTDVNDNIYATGNYSYCP